MDDTQVYVDRGEADGGTLECNIFVPPGEARLIIAAIPGAGFHNGIKEWMNGIAARCTAEVGALVVAMDYRGAPTYPYPAGRQDVGEACRWIQDHAGDYGVSVEDLPFVVFGSSAGGCDAALSAEFLARVKYQPVAAVCWSGLFDFDAAVGSDYAGEQVRDLFGGDHDPTQAELDSASPVKNIHKMSDRDQVVDFLIVCGENETPGIVADQSRAFDAALTMAGFDSELHVLPGGQHGTKLMSSGTPNGWSVTKPFLAKYAV